MTSTLRLAGFATAAVAALTLSGCASMRVSSYVPSGADFTTYRTYDWAPAEDFSTGDPRLDNNPFFQERVHASVEKELAARGLQKATSGSPDLLIHYHASISQRIDVDHLDREYGYDDGDYRPFVYEAGTLLIDFVDTRTSRLVWRGWAEGTMDGAIDNQDWMERSIDTAVARILGVFPGRL